MRFFIWLIKLCLASLIVGTVLDHFGISASLILANFGLSFQDIQLYSSALIDWMIPNLIVGIAVMIPLWILTALFNNNAKKIQNEK